MASRIQIISVLICAAFLTNCSKSSNSNGKDTISAKVAGGRMVNLKGGYGPEGAEEIVEAAYEIAMGPGFIYTREFLDRALQISPQHPQALFLRALMDWTPLTEGIISRFKPLTENDPSPEHRNQRIQNESERYPEGDLKTFLTKSGNEVHTEAQAQDFISSVEASLIRTREHLQKISRLPDFSAPFFEYNGASQNQMYSECAVTKVSDGVFMIKDCPWKTRTPRMISFADIKAINLAVAGVLTYSTLISSYHFDGAKQISRQIHQLGRDGRRPTEQEVSRIVQSQAQFLKLRSGHRLTDIIGYTNELSLAIVEAHGLQNVLCAKGARAPKNREGYLFEDGFCMGNEALQVADTLNRSMNGPVPRTFRGWRYSGNSWRNPTQVELITLVNIVPLLRGQITDLKQLTPTGFNACGSSTALRDPTLGGIFPNGDALEAIRIGNENFLRPVCQ